MRKMSYRSESVWPYDELPDVRKRARDGNDREQINRNDDGMGWVDAAGIAT